MDHSYYQDRLSAYHDRQLGPEETEALRLHLETCNECRALLAEFEKLEQVVEQHSALGEGDYWERQAQRIEQRIGGAAEAAVTDIRPKSRVGVWPRLVGAAAAVVVLGSVVLFQGDIWERTAPETKQAAPGVVVEESLQYTAPGSGPETEETVAKKPTEVAPSTGEQQPEEGAAVDRAEREEAELSDMALAELQETTGTEPVKEPQEAAEPLPASPEKEARIVTTSDMASNARSKPLAMPAGKSGESTLYRAFEAKGEPAEGVAGESAAETEAVPDYFAPDTASVETLRQRRDSLLTVLAQATSPHKELAVAKGRTVSAEVDIPATEKFLLSTTYSLAMQTDKDDERVEMIAFLRHYLARDSTAFIDEVTRYLEQLESNRK